MTSLFGRLPTTLTQSPMPMSSSTITTHAMGQTVAPSPRHQGSRLQPAVETRKDCHIESEKQQTPPPGTNTSATPPARYDSARERQSIQHLHQGYVRQHTLRPKNRLQTRGSAMLRLQGATSPAPCHARQSPTARHSSRGTHPGRHLCSRCHERERHGLPPGPPQRLETGAIAVASERKSS